MNEEEKKVIKRKLALQLEKYVTIFKEEFKEFIPPEKLNYLNGITNYEELIVIADTGTITCFVNNGIMYFPLLADKILTALRYVPGFGSRPNHMPYQNDNLILNNNTFIDYIKHTFLAGLNTCEFYEEMLLHEAMHLCGIAGAIAFQEGLAELKTRELAKKYNLKTSGCGYPKEVAIVYRLQEIFGTDLMNRIAFNMSNSQRRAIIIECLGTEGIELFDKVAHLMELEFQIKYYKHTASFTGITAPIKKTKMYDTIDYTEVYKVIDEYYNKYINKASTSVKNSN